MQPSKSEAVCTWDKRFHSIAWYAGAGASLFIHAVFNYIGGPTSGYLFLLLLGYSVIEEHIAELLHRGPIASVALLIAPALSAICHHAVVAWDTAAYERRHAPETGKTLGDPSAFLRWRVGGSNGLDCRPALLEMIVPFGNAAIAAAAATWLFS